MAHELNSAYRVSLHIRDRLLLFRRSRVFHRAGFNGNHRNAFRVEETQICRMFCCFPNSSKPQHYRKRSLPFFGKINIDKLMRVRAEGHIREGRCGWWRRRVSIFRDGRFHKIPIHHFLLLAGHIETLHENHHRQFIFRINPHRSTTRSAMTEAADARALVVTEFYRTSYSITFLRADFYFADL